MRRSQELNETVSVVDADTGAPAPPAASAGDHYLTDGHHLYRYLGVVDDSAAVVGLEDCRSLEIMLVAVDQLRTAELREVTPSVAG